MLDIRSPLIIGALPAGLALGAAAWLVAGGPSLATAPIAPFEDRFAKAAAAGPASGGHLSVVDVSGALSAPLFVMTTGHGAVADVVLRLDGIARSPHRTAALLSIGGAPAEWLTVGQTRDEVTLQEVQASKVLVDTATGFKTVELGETTQSASAAPGDRGQAAPGGAPASHGAQAQGGAAGPG